MTINYTTLLGLAQPVTGTETGQWGDVVNDEITSLLEDAVANAATFSVTSGNVTLTTTNGASNQARMSTLIITGTPGTTRNVIAPSQAKVYQVINQSDGAVVIKGSATTGVTIAAGATGTVVWNGSDFVEINSTSSGRIIKGNLQVTGNLQVDGNTQLGNSTSDTLSVTALVNANLLFTDNTYDIGASGATRPRTGYFGTSVLSPLLTATNLQVSNIKANDGTAAITIADSTGAVAVSTNMTIGNATSDTLTVTSTITSNLLFTDNTYDIGASGATRPRTLYLSNSANVTTSDGQILLTPTGWRAGERATILVKTLTNNPAEIDLLNTNGGLGYGWQISSRTGTSPQLHFYRNSNNTFTQNLILGPTENVFNGDLGDQDFRVASDTNSYALFVDAGLSRVGVNTSNLYQSFTVSGAIEAGTDTSTAGGVTMYQSYNGATNDYIAIWGAKNSSGGPAMNYGGYWNSTSQFLSAYDNFSGSHSSLYNAGADVVFNSDFAGSQTTTGSAVSGMAIRWQLGVNGFIFNEQGNDIDFRVESTSNTHALFVDASANNVGIKNNNPLQPLDVTGAIGFQNVSGATYQSNLDYPIMFSSEATGSIGFNGHLVLQPRGSAAGAIILAAGEGASAMTERLRVGKTEAVFNNNTTDYDFRVGSDLNSYMLWVDGSANGVNIGSSDTIQGQLNVSYTTGSANADTTALYITTAQTYGTATYKKNLDLVFQGYRDGAGSGNGAKARIRAIEQTGNTRAGTLEVTVLDGSGDLQAILNAASSSVTFNEGGIDQDFRVESDTNTHAFFVDAGTNRVNIGTSSAYAAAFTTSATGSYSSGDVNAMFVNPSGRPTIRLRSEASDACEIFFDTGGGVAWDISCRSAGEGKPMLWFPAAATPSYASVGAHVMTLTQTGNLTIVGALAKGSGSFQIDHPLPSLNETHHLVHSFVEAPQADLYYRGKVALVGGRATVNIDQVAGMTEGTFVLLNREVQCFTSNESDWDAVRGSVSGNILTIECQNPASTATISWMVVGERQDKHMYDTDWTDENGKVIVEPVKPPPIEPPTFDR